MLKPAAFAIDEHLRNRLLAKGEKANASRVAALVGEHRVSWGRYVSGDVEPSASRVLAWAIAQDLVVSTGPFGWEVEDR